MSKFKLVGRKIGDGLGLVIGEPIKYVGDKLANPLITEIGEGIKKVSTVTGETTGEFVGGTYKAVSGYIKNDELQKHEGIDVIVNSTNKTLNSMGKMLVQTWNQGEDVVNGFIDDDEEKMIHGARGLTKTIAISSLAIGAFELVDEITDFSEDADALERNTNVSASPSTETSDMNSSTQQDIGKVEYSSPESEFTNMQDIEEIETINDHLNGKLHPDTNILFHKDVVTLPNGDIVSGVFPDFHEEYTATLPYSTYLLSDYVQFDVANDQLAGEVQNNSELRSQFTPEQIMQIQAGETPDGYVWHHHQEPGRLELVDEETHARTGHSGGRSLWGGGSEKR